MDVPDPGRTVNQKKREPAVLNACLGSTEGGAWRGVGRN